MTMKNRASAIGCEANRHREAIETYVCESLVTTLLSLGALHEEASKTRGDGNVSELFKPWLAETRNLLVQRGLIVERAGRFVLRAAAASNSSLQVKWRNAQAEWLADPYQSASVRLVEICLQALPDILSGRRTAPEVMFPESSMTLVEGIYKNNPVADFFNDALIETLLSVLRQRLRRDPQARLRLFEVGAGTGGTTAPVLKRLDACRQHIEEYCYTDVSKSFLAYAEERYAPEHPFLKTAIFNAEEPAAKQGVIAGGYDVVIAANVIHATSNVARTLRNIKFALRANGVLLLNELTRKSVVTHVTFGLLGGWWKLEDAELRNAGSPSLSLASWRTVLAEEGYQSVLTPVIEVEEALGQQIFAAASNGVVRRSQSRLRVSAPAAIQQAAPANLRGGSLEYLGQILGQALKLRAEQIDPDEPLGNYGIDSILIGQLTGALKKHFPRVTTTLFFEKQTARELAAHLASSYPDEMARVLRGASAPVDKVAMAVEKVAPVALKSRRPPRDHDSVDSEIAIIGLSGRYPRAASVLEFWENLKQGIDCISEIPPDRWAIEGFYEASPDRAVANGRSYSKWGGFLDNVRGFDPMFFNISPREALGIDPQERLFLMSAWEVIEDAGYTRATLAEEYSARVGVFVGITKSGFELFGPPLWERGERLYPRTSFSAAANRVSYFLDLHGPSMAIDTMCSSSLVAIHEACLHLRQGACELAIAGGVNVYLHPSSYVGLSAARMLSEDGRCRAFGDGANGFVPGEGVGAVLLKPLSRAVADGDRIYAVIRGSSVNHGGRTNGFTVPNPNAQAQLITEALVQARIDARSIGYLESHGTGTDLGDPIEIAGLSEAFRAHTQDRGYCRIGSVKSNIGHLEAAAGMAGLSKVILQLREGVLVPTLHAQETNTNIHFDESPFVVQREFAPWSGPRVAGLSSFGAGGANAHLIVSAFAENAALSRPRPSAPFLIVLSARTAQQLKQVVSRLREHVRAHPSQELTFLYDLAYTLQVGREALEERLAFRVDSLHELDVALTSFLTANPGPHSLYQGRIKRHHERKGSFEWPVTKNHEAVLEAWIQGAAPDWRKLYENVSEAAQPRRISLPTYPFSQEEYWFPQSPAAAESRDVVTTFDGSEFFLSDHVIHRKKVLPAAAYLELARAAVQRNSLALELRQLVWSTPIEVEDQPKTVRLRITTAAADEVSWEFDTHEAGHRIVHARGVAVPGSRVEQATLSLAALRSRMQRGDLTADDCYAAFQKLGILYGPAHRGIRRLHLGHDELLAELVLPDSVAASAASYVLHPSILDSALQSCIGIDVDLSGGAPSWSALRGAIPFALRELRFWGACTAHMWAWIRKSDSPGTMRKLDIDLCDASGKIIVQMRDFSVRAIEPASADAVALLAPEWSPRSSAGRQVAPSNADCAVVLCGFEDSIDGVGKCVTLPLKGTSPGERFTELAASLLPVLKQSMNESAGRASLFQVVIPDGADDQPLLALSALLSTASLECKGWLGQLVMVPGDSSQAEIASHLASARGAPTTKLMRFEHGEVRTLRWKDVTAAAHSASSPWRHDGVYLITGGRGKLAQCLVDEISTSCPTATIILCGRQPENQAPQVTQPGVLYRQADVAQYEEVESLIRSVVAQHGALHGVIHTAGVTLDHRIAHKSLDEIRDVFAPKVTGVINLDRATAHLPLDLFAIWSSGAAIFGNPGQADYAAANAFMDQIAHWRNRLVRSGQRTGHTLSMNWPHWEDGGMQLTAAARAELLERFGLQSMSSRTGFDTFYRATHAMQSQVLVVTGDAERVTNALNASAAESAAAPLRGDSRQARVLLRRLIAATLRLRPEDIENDAEFGDLGFDSVLLAELAQALNRELSLSLDPTVFFDHPVLEDFAEYLAREFPQSFASDTLSSGGVSPRRSRAAVPMQSRPEADVQSEARDHPQARVHPEAPSLSESRSSRMADPVAIVGMSAEFPMAPNLEAFWNNLIVGKDCISEIPAQRWSWEALYGDPRTEPDKTNIKWGGFIDGAASFDPLFFSISPREAELMDPQQRLLMTHVYLAIEEAGFDPLSLSGSNTGIFVGTGNSGYGGLAAKAGYPIDAYSATSVIPSVGPNRMSFFLDLHGPSEPVDTACSSALVAIHDAVNAIRGGRCDMALAGGVMTIVTPDGHISFSKAGMLSIDGRCKAFSARANGYVRGEGVGIVMLMPLSAALAQGAHIHGVIRACAVNHGGHATSLTAPNPKAQAALLKMAYREAGIDPRTVSYIETHGTGTQLGDPIEINALKAAFKELYGEHADSAVSAPRCGLGSVKSNIGHLEMAAGVAGLIKVLLQFKHQTLLKTLHCEEPHPYIDLDGTPFYLLKENEHWAAPRDTKGGTLPRRAGVSSFGFGGVNAHVVLEEFVSPARAAEHAPPQQPVIVPLSARTRAQLKEVASALLVALGDPSSAEESAHDSGRESLRLDDVAFTLQLGRAALDHRLAVIASSMEELRQRLRGFVGDNEEEDGLHLGSAAPAQNVAAFSDDEELREAVDKWFRRRKLSQLADLWVRGAQLDWRKLHTHRMPERVSLPGYPFAKEQYWIANAARVNSFASAAMESARAEDRVSLRNPFGHVNRSDLSGLRFTSTLAGSEWFLADHLVRRQRVLPGVAYLELVRAAALEAAASNSLFVQFHNVVWLRPLVVKAEKQMVHVNVQANLQCEVTSSSESGGNIVHAQCRADVRPATSGLSVNLIEIKARMSRGAIEASECYQRFQAFGLDYGPAHRGITVIHCGTDEVLAELRLPQSASAERSRFVLHPSLMDAALQAAIGLQDTAPGSAGAGGSPVPFSAECITVAAPCVDRMWAWIRYAGKAGKAASLQTPVDIDLCDEQGRVCVAIRKLTSKTLEDRVERVWKPALIPDRNDESQVLCQLTGSELFVTDHMNVVPGVAYLEMMRVVATQHDEQATVLFENVVWPEPLLMVAGPMTLKIERRVAHGRTEFAVFSDNATRSVLHAQAAVVLGEPPSAESVLGLDFAGIEARCSKVLTVAELHQLLSKAPHGASMMPVRELRVGSNEAIATLRLPEGLAHEAGNYSLYPSLMHGIVLSSVLFALESDSQIPVQLPFSVEAVQVLGPLPNVARVHVVRHSIAGNQFSMQAADLEGRVCLVVKALSLMPLKEAGATLDPKIVSDVETDRISADDSAQVRIREMLIGQVAQQQKIAPERIQADVELSKYGLDSLGLTELTNALNRKYGLRLMPTIFFEHSTLNSFAEYLAQAHAERLVDEAAPGRETSLSESRYVQPGELQPGNLRLSNLQSGTVNLGAAHSIPVHPRENSSEPFAVVGMSGRLPGARELSQFWRHLEANADLVTPIPEGRWNQEATSIRAAGFMDDAECFDSLFFGISPREAEMMDPQQRLFLETAWACVEDAGYRSTDLSHSRTGVFVGVSTSDYRDLCLLQESSGEFSTGATFHFEVANRVSYALNLHGPSEAIDTACSSSLIALHRAVESMRAGNCDAAIVGGVNLIANPRLMSDMGNAGMLSPDGRCKTFDSRADGYGRGEGVAAILMKPLSAALAAGDHIYGLIRGSAENHGGRATSPTAPNPVAQRDLLIAAYSRSGIAPSTVTYVETHGTGTQLGDPIEINGLKDAFSQLAALFHEAPSPAPHCAVGSVKTNIGHLEAAAGISAVIKVLLMLQHRRLPGNPHLIEPNPFVSLAGSPFYLAKETVDWEASPRRAGISSFGVGGSNAHVIFEEFVEPQAPADEKLPDEFLIPLSAKSEDRLRAYAQRLAQFVADLTVVEEDEPGTLARIARTLQLGRDAMSCRVVFGVQSLAEMAAKLRSFATGDRRIARCWRGEDLRSESFASHHDRLASAWAQGESVEWRSLYGPRPPRRISLPTYPFAPVRHWLPRTSTSAAKQNSANDVVIAFPVWRALTSNQDAPRGLKRLVVLCSGGSVTPRQIEERLKGSLCVAIESREASFAARFTAVSRRLFEIVQDALRHKIPRLAPSERLLVQVVISDRPENACFSALAGLLKSAHQENPLFLGQVVWLSPETKLEQVEKTLSDLATTPNESVIRHRSGEREVQRWMDASAQAPVEVMPWKSGGVYLITGGMGGLGRLFAAEILERASSAHVVLVGRSPLEGAQLEALAQLRAKGSVVYEQVDVCNPLDVRSMIERITQRHGSLQAVIHSAGVHRDNYVLNKTIAELESVLAPKVTGTWNLDDATRHLDLDFFILFSSGTGVAGNAGQSDYAMANAFMDEYASYRNAQVAKGSGHGLSLSFDWSLWADGGMKLDVSSAAHLREQLGIKPLETSSALRAFYAGLALCQAQVMMVGGEASKIRERVFGGLLLEGDASRASKSAEDGGALLSKVRAALKSAVVELIKVPESALGLDDRLDDFGLDSMMVTRLNQRLRDGLGDLPKTLFYEHRTLESIAEYLTSAHQDACLRWVGSRLSKAYAIPQDQPPAPETLPTVAGPTPVAVIGMSGRYPGARNLAELWERLKQGESCITEIPASRWSLERFYHSNVDEAVELGKSYGKWGGFLEDHAAFDPLFFNISAKDAAMISPQERLFLETCWHALEDGGYCPSKWSDAERERVGVYGAVTKTQANTSFAALVNRVSFAMDLRGPSMPVDTKCSSALVALHHACEALARRDIDVAIVGAVNLYLEPETYIELAKMHLLCTSATPAVFSAGGRGFVPSEGVGALVLKRLPDAQRSRDGILAVVRGTAVNHNGRTLSFGAPSAEQQTAVIQRAVSVAQIDPRSISYIESAANGSEMSDAIEIRALNNAFAPSLSDRAEPPRIGSLKSALGHAEAASGMAQLTKVILQLQHRTLCGTLVAPDATDVDVGSFQLQRASSNWESANTPRRAGVHSTGASGVNAHAIVEEYEPEHIEEESVAAHPVVFAISAKTESALRRYLESWRQYLAAHSESNLARLAYSAQRGREAMKYRFACVADSVATLLEQLESAHPQGVRGVAVKLQSRAEGYQNLADVARRWVEGEEIEWERLYPHSVPRMMHGLPTYPFSRKPYGLRSGEPVKAEEEAPADVTSIQRTLRGLINKLLAFEADDEIDATGNFAEMGFDSISIVKFVEAVSETFEVRLEVTAPFNYPSINTLAEHIGALRKKASPGLDMESLLMGLAQDDLQVDDALELLERQTWDAVSP